MRLNDVARLLLGIGVFASCSPTSAASAENEYVVVTCGTQGVEAIVPVDDDFYITTRGVSSPPFEADIGVVAKSPWILVLPPDGKMELEIGESDIYKVEDESGVEDDVEGNVYVLSVESILPDIGQEIDDGDGDDDTKVFVVSVTNTSDVTVTATLNPAIAETDLPSGWTIKGGTGSGKLQRTVSTASSSKTVFTFTCGGTDSGLKTTIYVYDAKLGLYADEGNEEQDKYGHSWWTFTVDSDIEALIRSLHSDINDPKYFGTAGWWPNTDSDEAKFDPIKGWCTSAPGLVRFGNQNHTATGSKVWDIGYDELLEALSYVQELETSGKDWTVLLDNCTDEAIIVGNEAGITTISYWGITTPEELSDWLNAN